METNNFMMADFRAILVGCCLFSIVGFGPGYAFGRLFDIIGFRRRAIACQAALSVVLSISLSPIFTYFIGRFISLSAALVFFASLSVYAAIRIALDLGKLRSQVIPLLKSYSKAIGITLLWIVVAILSLADMQLGRRLYFSVIGFDYSVRAAFTSAVSTFGIPPPNPFYFAGHSALLRYHYFWLAQAALLNHLAQPLIDARQAFISATVWCGVGVLCIVALYLRFFSPAGSEHLRRRSVIGFCLLAVTGLDILPTLFVVLLKRAGSVATIFPSVEWWNNQIDGFLYTMLWEPHYLAALIACLTGFLILWKLPPVASKPQCLISTLAAGASFATGVGTGFYVALVFAVFLICWMAITLSKRWYRETILLAGAGLVAMALSVPFLVDLRTAATGGALLHTTVRSFLFGEFFLQALGFSHSWQLALGNGIFLPLNYFLELGFYLAAAKIYWDRFRREKRSLTRYELATVAMICASAFVCTFFRSGVIDNNDLGWRGFLIAQFALLVMSADLWANRSRPLGPGQSGVMAAGLSLRQKQVLASLLVLGGAGVVYDLVIFRMYPVFSDGGSVAKLNWLATDEKLGDRTFANRGAYEWLQKNTSPRAVIQQNPRVAIQDNFYGLYADRRTVAEAENCGTVFGGDPGSCRPIVDLLNGLYSGAGSSGMASFNKACESLRLDVLIAKDVDAAWSNQNSWVWRQTPIYSNKYVRAFACFRQEGNLVLTYRGKNRD